MNRRSNTGSTRRGFIKTTSTAAVAVSLGTAATSLAGAAPRVHSGSDETLRIGLIGCGGRGISAVQDAMAADANCKLTAMCDIFADRITRAQKILARSVADRMDVPEERMYSDFDGYKGLIDSGVDVVLMCATPHFRPAHIRYAIDAGKHVFCEKPVAVDAPGVRSVLETCQLAKQKNLNVVSGLCWRYDLKVNEVMKRIKDGEIGDITAIQANYLTGPLWYREPQPDWTQMENQIRNWLYYTWLSADHIAEQHIHSLDKALWLMNDEPPASCYGIGGRQMRTEPQWGNVYDHFTCCYEWKNGVKAFTYTRQMPHCYSETDDHAFGTHGRASILSYMINGRNGQWRCPDMENDPGMYVSEHQSLFRAIRNGQVINNGQYMCDSTLMAILGREACYSGQRMTWDEMWNSNVKLGPAEYRWGDVEVEEVLVPGKKRRVLA